MDQTKPVGPPWRAASADHRPA